MLSARAYNLLKEVILKSRVRNVDASYERELWDISHPYVLCIHRPTRRAFLLNRRYLHITDVSFCAVPDKFTEHTENHLCASFECPEWAKKEDHSEFDSYWLY